MAFGRVRRTRSLSFFSQSCFEKYFKSFAALLEASHIAICTSIFIMAIVLCRFELE